MFLILFLSTKGQKNPQTNQPLLVGHLVRGARIIGGFRMRSSEYWYRFDQTIATIHFAHELDQKFTSNQGNY